MKCFRLPCCYGVLKRNSFTDVTACPCFIHECGGAAAAVRKYWIYHSSYLLNCCNFCWIWWSQCLCIHCEPGNALAEGESMCQECIAGTEIRVKELVSGHSSYTLWDQRVLGFFWFSFCLLCFPIEELNVKVSGWKSAAVAVQAITSSIITVPFGLESRIRRNIVVYIFSLLLLVRRFLIFMW